MALYLSHAPDPEQREVPGGKARRVVTGQLREILKKEKTDDSIQWKFMDEGKLKTVKLSEYGTVDNWAAIMNKGGFQRQVPGQGLRAFVDQHLKELGLPVSKESINQQRVEIIKKAINFIQNYQSGN